MNKEESLSFLQNCIGRVNLATEQDIKFFQEIYDRDCVTPVVSSDFDFFPPMGVSECDYVIKAVYDLVGNNEDLRNTVKKDIDYNFLGLEPTNQQNNDNLIYAA